MDIKIDVKKISELEMALGPRPPEAQENLDAEAETVTLIDFDEEINRQRDGVFDDNLREDEVPIGCPQS